MPSFIDLSKKSSYGATTAEDAVNNILYSASTSSRAKNRHMLSVLVDNQSGVLSKISGSVLPLFLSPSPSPYLPPTR